MYLQQLQIRRGPTTSQMVIFLLLVAISAGFPSLSRSQQNPCCANKETDFVPHVWALESPARDVERVAAFYPGALGFEIESNSCCMAAGVLRNGSTRLILRRDNLEPAVARLRDPSNNLLKLMEIPARQLTMNGIASDTIPGDMPALAQAGFNRFKLLEGHWQGRSTKGWEETITFKTIAKGSVVVETSFDAHPNETMMTMFYLDGTRLLLTHYCVAGSQPRLEATSFEENGNAITFTFLDATNLPSRDRGHMDKAVFRFVDEDHFSAQWTWYQDGKENWMEEIKYERKR